METYLQIAKYNLKINMLPHILLMVLFCIFAPIIIGTQNLNSMKTAQVLEYYLSLCGPIICIPLFLPDQNKEIRDLMKTKSIPVIVIHLIRTVELIFSLIVAILLFLLYLKESNCDFIYEVYFYATLATCFFLGGLGALIFSISDNMILAYMIPIMYYLLCFFNKSEIMKQFFLFSLSKGSLVEKHYLFIAGIIMIGLSIICRNTGVWKIHQR